MQHSTKLVLISLLLMITLLKFQNSSIILETPDGNRTMALIDCSNDFKFTEDLKESFKKVTEAKFKAGTIYFAVLTLLLIVVSVYMLYVYFQPNHLFGPIPAMGLILSLLSTLFAEYYALSNLEDGVMKPGRGVALDTLFLLFVIILYFMRTKPKVMPMAPVRY